MAEEIDKGQWKGWSKTPGGAFEKTFPGKVTIRSQQGYFYYYIVEEDAFAGPYGTLDEALSAESDSRKGKRKFQPRTIARPERE